MRSFWKDTPPPPDEVFSDEGPLALARGGGERTRDWEAHGGVRCRERELRETGRDKGCQKWVL
eukprot:143328-Chlamydomonas_euryale.AAC.1